VAAGRCIESRKDENVRQFYDPYAEKFCGEVGFKQLEIMASTYKIPNAKQRVLDCIVKRTKFIDDSLINAIDYFNKNIYNNSSEDKNTIQIAMLGVGCDTRSYRLHQVSQNKTNEIIVFEVDFQDVLDYRTEILESECKAQTNATIHKIACDLRQTEKLIKELKSNGFNEEIPNIWILEGVITYFTEDELHNLLDVISNKLYKKSKKKRLFSTNIYC